MLENNSGKTKTKKRHCSNKRKQKLSIVFDEDARREFLTGFHKRKLQRKSKAKEEFEKQLKAERKKIKSEVKEQYKKLLLSQKSIPELNNILSENLDMGTHSVSITELSPAVLAKENNWIGINEAQYYDRKGEEPKESNRKTKEGKLESMEVKGKKNKSSDSNISGSSCKEIKRKIKQQTTYKIKNSTIFKKNAKLDRIKNIKLKKKQEKKLEKLKRKRRKHKKN